MNTSLQPGQNIGPYRLDALLGQGGMAQVWKAWHGGLHRFEALKILPPQMTLDRAFVERFLAEARTAANLNHPNIAAIHAVSNDELQPFFAMELVEGGDLSESIEARGRYSLEEALPILRQIADALDYAHGRGVIHRDIKPANIMLAREGRVKMVDFGIARASEEPDGARLTKTGMILGTPAYMSPEQGGSGAPVDFRSDLYSFGVVTYEMLCGQVPFGAGKQTSTITVIMDHIRTPIPSPRSLNPGLPMTVEKALQIMLAKAPTDRFGSAAEFVSALQSKEKARESRAQGATSSKYKDGVRLNPKKRLAPALLGIPMLAGMALVAYGLKTQPSVELVAAPDASAPTPRTTEITQAINGTTSSSGSREAGAAQANPTTSASQAKLIVDRKRAEKQLQAEREVRRQKIAQQKVELPSLVETWRAAWQNHDLDHFMSLYDSRVKVDGVRQSNDEYRTYHASENNKQPRMQIDVSNVQVLPVDGDEAAVTFDQKFTGWNTSSALDYESRGHTTLTFARRGDGWKIISERFRKEWSQNY